MRKKTLVLSSVLHLKKREDVETLLRLASQYGEIFTIRFDPPDVEEQLQRKMVEFGLSKTRPDAYLVSDKPGDSNLARLLVQNRQLADERIEKERLAAKAPMAKPEPPASSSPAKSKNIQPDDEVDFGAPSYAEEDDGNMTDSQKSFSRFPSPQANKIPITQLNTEDLTDSKVALLKKNGVDLSPLADPNLSGRSRKRGEENLERLLSPSTEMPTAPAQAQTKSAALAAAELEKKLQEEPMVAQPEQPRKKTMLGKLLAGISGIFGSRP